MCLEDDFALTQALVLYEEVCETYGIDKELDIATSGKDIVARIDLLKVEDEVLKAVTKHSKAAAKATLYGIVKPLNKTFSNFPVGVQALINPSVKARMQSALEMK